MSAPLRCSYPCFFLISSPPLLYTGPTCMKNLTCLSALNKDSKKTVLIATCNTELLILHNQGIIMLWLHKMSDSHRHSYFFRCRKIPVSPYDFINLWLHRDDLHNQYNFSYIICFRKSQLVWHIVGHDYFCKWRFL